MSKILFVSIVISSFVYCFICKKIYLNSLSANYEYTCHPKSCKAQLCLKMVWNLQQNGICKKEQRVVGQEMQEPRQKLISYI